MTQHPPQVEVIIEIPRGSFLKRGSTGHIDFISPLPCPFNYGSVTTHIGLEGDLLDAVVLGPRLERGSKLTISAYGAIGLTDRSMYDDKLICSTRPLSDKQINRVVRFFKIYAQCKRWLNYLRGQTGKHACEGWGSAEAAIGRAMPLSKFKWNGPRVSY